MDRRWFVGLSLVLSLALLMVVSPNVGAQSDADRFDQLVGQEQLLSSLAGPFGGDLVQLPDVLVVSKAGIDVADFVAHALFTNPIDDPAAAAEGDVVEGDETVADAASDLPPWDYGFQFRTTGNNDDLRLSLVGDGTWNVSVGPNPPTQTVALPDLDLEPGGTNALDLIVEGDRAIFGVNGEFIAGFDLPASPTSGDVFASTGFFTDLVVEDRAIGLSEFQVWSLPTDSQLVGLAGFDPSTVAEARPVTLRAGTCTDPGDTVEELNDLTYPDGDRLGQETAVVAQTSFTRVPLLLEDLLGEPHVIDVALSEASPDARIACGEVGGILDELGAYVIALGKQNDSIYSGIAYIAPSEEAEETNLSVFLAPDLAAYVPPAGQPEAVAPMDPVAPADPDASSAPAGADSGGSAAAPPAAATPEADAVEPAIEVADEDEATPVP